MRTIDTDVLIVGSGFGAAAPALRLSEAGFQVTMIEKGPFLDPDRDFRQTQDPRYVRRYLKGLTGDRLSLTYAEALGGGSGFYEMVSLRAPTKAFEQTDPHGARLWPNGVDRSALDPYYDVAESMLHVEQIAVEEIPRSGLVFAEIMKRLGYSCDRARYAVRGCVGSGYCVTGCVFGAKQSLLLNYLPKARAAGARIETNLEAIVVRTIAEVRETPIAGPLRSIPYRYEVACRTTGPDSEEVRFRCRLLILGAGTVGTAALLLRSKSTLPLLSHHLGKNVAFNGSVKAVGMLADDLPDGDLFVGRTHPGMISYEFLESHGITISAVKPMPLQIAAGARLTARDADRRYDYWGVSNVEIMKRARTRMVILYAIGLTPPRGELSLPRGEEQPRLRLDVNADLSVYYQRTQHLLDSILDRSGCTRLRAEMLDPEGTPYDELHFFSAHHVGSCRMADSASRGVVDARGEAFLYPGLYVSDGASIPSSLAVNSSLTILANAERIAAGIVERHGGRAIALARGQTEGGSPEGGNARSLYP